MSYSEARNHFDKARNATADEAIIEIADGLKHLSHAIEEDIMRLEQNIRDQNARRWFPVALHASFTAAEAADHLKVKPPHFCGLTWVLPCWAIRMV
jgi:hypothetical protein